MQIDTVNKIAPARRTPDLRAYAATVIGCWIVAILAAIFYARLRQIPSTAAVPIIAAFLIEIPLYFAPFFEAVRVRLRRLNPWLLAAGLAITAVLPYLTYSIPTHSFGAFACYELTGLAISLSFWYLVLPLRPWSDLLFLAGPAAIMMSRVLKPIYLSPLPRERVDILGKLMLIHVAAIAVLVLRGLPGINPGLIPTRRETWIGFRSFLLFLPVGFVLLRILHVPPRPQVLSAWLALPIFLGAYLVPAWSEEFALRGIVQQHLSAFLGVPVGIAIASAIFGLAHLNFGTFPNWPMAALASSAGLFYGLAYYQASSIRASMLAHALTVTAWTLCFR